MSHQPERKDKDCLNCGAIVQGRFCHQCGQENIVTHQSFGKLFLHFVYDIFHFDGKFFDTLKYLFIWPGGVPKEYVKGRRNRYLDPIRMYLFTSAVFFLIFFSFKVAAESVWLLNTRYLTKLERFDQSAALYPQVKKSHANTVLQQRLDYMLDTTVTLKLQKKTDTTVVSDSSFNISLNNSNYVATPIRNFSLVDTANSIWVERRFENKWQKYQAQYGDDPNKLLAKMGNDFLHKLPYMLFVSLPIFALFLNWVYWRQKQFYYSDHAVFTLYHYIFSFLVLLLFFGFNALADWSGWSFFNTIGNLFLILWPLYLYLGMRRFYGQGWRATFGKFVLVNLLGFLSLVGLFILFILISFIQL